MTHVQPGKVLLCSLGAKGLEGPGKLGKDGKVYRVIIAAEANTGSSTHAWVNGRWHGYEDGKGIAAKGAQSRRPMNDLPDYTDPTPV